MGGTCPLIHGFHNDGILYHLNTVLSVRTSLGLFAQFTIDVPSP
jgi:hypothetical protein